MANLPSRHPNLSIHLTDRALAPLITSSRATPQLQALTSLSHTALSVLESTARLGLGAPQRIMVEHGATGPVLLHSFLNTTATDPSQAGPASVNGPQAPLSSLAGPSDEGAARAEASTSAAAQQDDLDAGANAPPMLLGTVLAPGGPESAFEARRAAARLERVGREVQAHWCEDNTG